MKDDINSLSHSKWRCKYHIVFAPKYRRKEIYGDIRKDIGVILRKLCEQKKRGNNRGGIMSRPYPYLGEYSAESECCTVCRICKREKSPDDIR